MTTINKQISSGTDDCYEDNDLTVHITATSVWVGYISNTRTIGVRWQSINIPQGTTITSAKLSMYLTSKGGTLSANVRGIDEDNTAIWSIGSRPSQRTKTTATVNANEANWTNWATGNWTDITITSAIQEIINRAGWSANNALAVVVEDSSGVAGNYGGFRSYEYAGNVHGAKLEIIYTAGRTTKNARAITNVHPGVMFQVLTGGKGY